MYFLRKIRQSNFWIRLSSWEYWPFEIVYFPVFFYWLWLALRARNFFFFSASNPGIEYGGMLGESKFTILNKINDEIKPKTIYIKSDIKPDELENIIDASGLNYSLIFKPDVGERGWKVDQINNFQEAAYYLNSIDQDFIIQELVDDPIELGVFYYRYPNKPRGKVSSIVIKEMLHVVGDGKSTIRELMYKNPRAKLQLEELEKNIPELITLIPGKGEIKELVPFGNHCRGAKFLNGNHLINEQLVESFDKIASNIEGFYFGRFDLKCKSYEALNRGEVKIMELNGAGSEPGHIYHPGTSIFKAYSSIFEHLHALFQISKINNQLGVSYLSIKEGWFVIKQTPIFKKLRMTFSS